jgi:hypothetical protein
MCNGDAKRACGGDAAGDGVVLGGAGSVVLGRWWHGPGWAGHCQRRLTPRRTSCRAAARPHRRPPTHPFTQLGTPLAARHLAAGNECGPQLAQVWLNGEAQKYSYTTNKRAGSNHTTLSVKQISYTTKRIGREGLTLCMQLLSPCDSLPKLCSGGVCRYAVFDPLKTCCPVGDANLPAFG